MTDAQLIYTRMIQGGVGYAPRLYRIGKKYFTVRGDTDAEGFKKLADMDIPESKSKRPNHLWLKHSYENIVTASEFLVILAGGA